MSDKHLCSIIAAIEILEYSRLAFHNGDQVADCLMEPLVEIKDSKGVRRNVGVISGQVEVCVGGTRTVVAAGVGVVPGVTAGALPVTAVGVVLPFVGGMALEPQAASKKMRQQPASASR